MIGFRESPVLLFAGVLRVGALLIPKLHTDDHKLESAEWRALTFQYQVFPKAKSFNVNSEYADVVDPLLSNEELNKLLVSQR